jgi:hypothetical protein
MNRFQGSNFFSLGTDLEMQIENLGVVNQLSSAGHCGARDGYDAMAPLDTPWETRWERAPQHETRR